MRTTRRNADGSAPSQGGDTGSNSGCHKHWACSKGAHVVAGVAGVDDAGDSEVLRLAGGVESDCEHSLARAIVAAARERGALTPARDFRSLTDTGLDRATVQAAVDEAGYELIR